MGLGYNIQDVTELSLVIYPGETPLKIDSIRFLKHDTIISPIEPFTATLASKGKNGKDLNWRVNITFPLINKFKGDEIIAISTDKGVINVPGTYDQWRVDQIAKEKDKDIAVISIENEMNRKSADSFRKLFVLFLVLSTFLIGVSIWLIMLYRNALTKNKELIEAGNNTDHFYSDHDKTYKMVMNLFQDRFVALNTLCDEYYEKRDTDLLKSSILKSVLHYIDTMKTKEALSELTNILNAVNNDIITHVKEQIPILTDQEINFLIYVFSGFSPRTVCVLTNINLSQFYYRRTKIKEVIAASKAPDTEILIARLMKYK